MKKNIFLIPVYNDWQSLNELLKKLNKELELSSTTGNVLIINDFSTISPQINFGHLEYIKEIKLINLNRNLASQKSIAIGLKYLEEQNDSEIITIMDADGEDDPTKINEMIDAAKENKNFIITSNRTNRKENLLFKSFYIIHKIFTFLFTFHWISYGNFSSFHSENLSKILKNNTVWLAYSSSVSLNCKIKRKYAKRKERYFGKSKVNFINLVIHSFRVMSVLRFKIIIFSLIYSTLIIAASFYFKNYYFLILVLLIIFFNFILIFVRYKNNEKSLNIWKSFIKDIEII